MNELSYSERILKLLQQCNRRIHIPDLHSFVASIENGSVFVQCEGHGAVWIEERTYDKDGNEEVNQFNGSLETAAKRLEELKIDLLSVEM